MRYAEKTKIPRAFLICCEGKTEEEYFNILLDFYRLPVFVEVEVFGEEGQHYKLIDNTVAKRNEFCSTAPGLKEDEIECWAVCDEDKMPFTYTKLNKYANENGVNLAFSAPQFEIYLLQHFEQSADTDISVAMQKLGSYCRKFGGEDASFGDYKKADLDWLREAIDHKPKIVDVAIGNSDERKKSSKRPFLTVQELVKRIKELCVFAR